MRHEHLYITAISRAKRARRNPPRSRRDNARGQREPPRKVEQETDSDRRGAGRGCQRRTVKPKYRVAATVAATAGLVTGAAAALASVPSPPSPASTPTRSPAAVNRPDGTRSAELARLQSELAKTGGRSAELRAQIARLQRDIARAERAGTSAPATSRPAAPAVKATPTPSPRTSLRPTPTSSSPAPTKPPPKSVTPRPPAPPTQTSTGASGGDDIIGGGLRG